MVKCPQWLIYSLSTSDISILLDVNVHFESLLCQVNPFFTPKSVTKVHQKCVFANPNTWKLNVTARGGRRSRLVCVKLRTNVLCAGSLSCDGETNIVCSRDTTRRKIFSWRPLRWSHLTLKCACVRVWRESSRTAHVPTVDCLGKHDM